MGLQQVRAHSCPSAMNSQNPYRPDPPGMDDPVATSFQRSIGIDAKPKQSEAGLSWPNQIRKAKTIFLLDL